MVESFNQEAIVDFIQFVPLETQEPEKLLNSPKVAYIYPKVASYRVHIYDIGVCVLYIQLNTML